MAEKTAIHNTVAGTGLAAALFLAIAASPALAQTEQECPLRPGATPIDPPPVSAEQVEDGSGSLADFASALTEQIRAEPPQGRTAAQGQYLACLSRQDGPWRSGSTYLMTLSPEARLFVHANDMSLSGRKINPLIYASILRSLEIAPTVLQNPAAAFAAFLAAATKPTSYFNVPDIPGASGYVSVFLSHTYGTPYMLLVGFDLNESHLVQEEIDYGNPAITARDVVDRASLKAFVVQAGEYFLELARTDFETGTNTASSQAKIALRDPNGPWRHGSVYLYVLSLTTSTILFHAAFPDVYELRPLEPIRRDVVTGELILPQVIEAAKSSPEGGFVEYHFDDPADDSDRLDIPKVGYARVFSTDVVIPGRGERTISFIVGSGFYPSADQDPTEHQTDALESVMPQVMRAMTASTLDAVSGRVENAVSRTASSFSLGGASTLSDILMASGKALENGTLDLARLLNGSAFAVPLNATGSGGAGGKLAFWGSGDYRNISGGNQSMDYDGGVTSASIGVDTRFGTESLFGVAITRSLGKADYKTSATATDELTATLASVSPYMGWHSTDGRSLWAALSLGSGEVEIEGDPSGTRTSDLTQRMAAIGMSWPLVSDGGMLEGGTTSLQLNGEAAYTWAVLEGSGLPEDMELSAHRQRLILKGVHEQILSSGATLSPSLEVGLRNDTGDGDTGAGIEGAGGLRYSGMAGLTIEGKGRISSQRPERLPGMGRERAGALWSWCGWPRPRTSRAAFVGSDNQQCAAIVGQRHPCQSFSR